MRNAIFCLSDEADTEAIEHSIEEMVAEVQTYVPGYRLKQKGQFDRMPSATITASSSKGSGDRSPRIKSSIFLEIEGAAHYLPAYAGNLDIVTSAVLKSAEKLAERKE